MKKGLFLLFFTAIYGYGFAKNDSIALPLIVSVFNNSTLLPGQGIIGIGTPIHPGVRVGTYVKFKDKPRHDLLINFNVGCYYHRLSQTGIQLYTEPTYRYKFPCGFSMGTQLIAGYLLAKPDVQVFELNDKGSYEKQSYWRSQMMAGAGFDLSYKFFKNAAHPVQMFLNYQFILQMPFVKNYVPMLPNTAIHIGTIVYINRKNN